MLGLRAEDIGSQWTAEARSPLEGLYLRHAPRAMRLAYLLTGERAGAEDLVQDAFIRVASKTSKLDNDAAFAGYLRKTIVNLHTSRMRRRKVERAYIAREASRPTTDAVLPDIDIRNDMRRRLLALPPRQRAALVLRYYEDLSEAEAAAILRCSPGAVKSLTSRGVRALRAEMRGEA